MTPDHDCIMQDKILDIMSRLTAMQETINNEIYGHKEKNGLKADVIILKESEARKQKLVGFVWASFLTAISGLVVSLLKTNH